MKAMYEWNILVTKYDYYGERIVSRTPARVRAATRSELTEKVRAAFEATYDDFRKFWSHGWELKDVTEVEPPREVTAEQVRQALEQNLIDTTGLCVCDAAYTERQMEDPHCSYHLALPTADERSVRRVLDLLQ